MAVGAALHGEEVGVGVVCLEWQREEDQLEPELPPDSVEQDEDKKMCDKLFFVVLLK